MEVRIRDVDVHYDQVGEGRPLILLHGWEAVGQVLLASVEPLFATRTGWRRIYPDLPGHGKTPISPTLRTHEDVLNFILEFVDAVAPGEPFCIGGWSWGGYLALGAVFRVPERVAGVVLNVPAVDDRHRPAHRTIRWDDGFTESLGEHEGWLVDEVVSQSVDLLASTRVYQALLVPQDPVIGSVVSRPFSFDPVSLPKPYLGPALVITGRQDHEVGYEAAWGMRANFPRASFAVLDGAGHFLDAEKPKIVAAFMEDWLDRVDDEFAGRSRPRAAR